MKKIIVTSLLIVSHLSFAEMSNNTKPTNINQQKSLDFNKSEDITPRYINKDDIIINANYDNISHYFLIDIRRKDGKLLYSDDFFNKNTQLNQDKISLTSYWMKSSLTNIEKIIAFPEQINSESYSQLNYKISPSDSVGICEALYISYQMKGDSAPSTQAIIFNKIGQSSTIMDKQCSLDKSLSQDFFGYTEDNYITGFHWNKLYANVKKPVIFNAIISKEGQELLPSYTQAYAISDDFSHFYIFNKKTINGQYNFKQQITYPSLYFLHLQFKGEDSRLNHFNSKLRVKE